MGMGLIKSSVISDSFVGSRQIYKVFMPVSYWIVLLRSYFCRVSACIIVCYQSGYVIYSLVCKTKSKKEFNMFILLVLFSLFSLILPCIQMYFNNKNNFWCEIVILSFEWIMMTNHNTMLVDFKNLRTSTNQNIRLNQSDCLTGPWAETWDRKVHYRAVWKDLWIVYFSKRAVLDQILDPKHLGYQTMLWVGLGSEEGASVKSPIWSCRVRSKQRPIMASSRYQKR